MPIPPKPKNEPRPIARTFKMSKTNVEWLVQESGEKNRSQADIIDYLITKERTAKKRPKTKR